MVFLLGSLSLFLLNRYYLSNWYNFTLKEHEITVLSDECETCFLDWPFYHTIKIETPNAVIRRFNYYTEGPRLEFGLNKKENKIIISCPGFSYKIIDLEPLQINDDNHNHMPDSTKKNFFVHYTILKSKKVVKLKTPNPLDSIWEERSGIYNY